MASSTIIRVKRRREASPKEALLVLCKRPKVDTKVAEEVSSVFVFSGTVTNQNDDIKKIVKSLPSTGRPQVNIIETLREDRAKSTVRNRYEVISRCRGIQDVDVLDLEKTENKNDNRNEIENEDISPYEYDVYTASTDFDPIMIDDIVQVDDFEVNWRLPCTDDEDDDEESIDSNDENYWENDYPDEEDRMKLQNYPESEVELGNGDLSSDDEVENYAGVSYADDVKDFGTAYARYKAKVLAEEENISNNLVHSVKIVDDSDGENNVSSSFNDSDDGFYYGQDEDLLHSEGNND